MMQNQPKRKITWQTIIWRLVLLSLDICLVAVFIFNCFNAYKYWGIGFPLALVVSLTMFLSYTKLMKDYSNFYWEDVQEKP